MCLWNVLTCLSQVIRGGQGAQFGYSSTWVVGLFPEFIFVFHASGGERKYMLLGIFLQLSSPSGCGTVPQGVRFSVIEGVQKRQFFNFLL